jgi:hypothetical protein
MIERSRRVVLLIDYDNLQICASRDTPGRDLQLAPVVQLAQHYGTVILARAYAEWNLSTERLAVYKAGIEPAFAPVLRTEGDRSGKSLADTVMVAEGMDMLWTLSPDVVVLATSDKDLIPLVRVAKQRGAFVVVLGSDFTAIPLREMADEHVTYRQLITDASGRFTTEAGPARQPAALTETPHRRPRERTGRERAVVAPPTTTAAPAPVQPPVQTPSLPPMRTEREPSPAVNAAEPVAPLTVGLAGEADSQGLGRRRRRRGSRRRSERVGLPGEGPLGSEAGFEADADVDGLEESNAFDDQEALAADVDAAEEPDASLYVAATYATEPDEATNNRVDAAHEDVATLPDAPDASLPDELASLDVEGVVPAPPPVTPTATTPLRDRRRRTRRPTAAAQDPLGLTPPVEAAEPVETRAPDTSPADEPAAAPSDIPDLVVDPLAPTATAGDEPTTEVGEPVAEEAAPVRRTRRRTTGPTAGRARSTPR